MQTGTRATLQHTTIFRYIEFWYNRKRRHSSLGGMIPAEYDDQLALNPSAA